MKKAFLGILIAAVVVLVLGTAGFAYAQATNPPTPTPGAGYGRGNGMMNGQGMMRGGMVNGQMDGPMHDEMVAVFAAKLGIPVDELNARLAKGESMAQIATSQGLTGEQINTLMAEAHTQALAEAVKNGSLTQEQADAMQHYGTGMGMGAGRMAGRGMMGGRGGMMGQGQAMNPDCPMATSAGQ